MTRVLIGDALVNEDERLQARMNQLYRAAGGDAAPVAAHRPGRQRLARRSCADAAVLIAYVVGRWHLFAKSGFKRAPQDGWPLQRKFLFG